MRGNLYTGRFFRTVSLIILFSFIFTVFSPYISLATDAKKKSDTGKKRFHPQLPAKVEKPKKLAELEKKAEELKAKEKKKSDEKRKSDSRRPVWYTRAVKTDGTVVEFSSEKKGSKSTKKEVKPPSRAAPAKAPSITGRDSGYPDKQYPKDYVLYREVQWPVDGLWYYFDATPPPDTKLKTYLAAGGSVEEGEDVAGEYLYNYRHVTYSNPTGDSYLIYIYGKWISPTESQNTYNDGTGNYEAACKFVYSSWLDGSGNECWKKDITITGYLRVKSVDQMGGLQNRILGMAWV